MKQFILRVCMSLLWGSLSFTLFAQEKTQAYYNTHEKEILTDAQAAFQSGNYSRTIELCNWHYIIVGDQAAESLREMAGRCAHLSREMNELRSNGDIKGAKQKASAILSLNPDDVAAKLVLLIEDPVSQIQDTVAVETPVTPKELDIPPLTENQKNDSNGIPQLQEIQSPLNKKSSVPDAAQPYQPRTRFVVKAGATVVDLKQFFQTIAPGGSIGVYDLGGGPIGGEIGVSICPGLSAVSASLFSADASLVFRAAKNIYPKLGIGFFSCKSTETNTSTSGICAGGGLTFMVGGHFCLEIGAKYYPKVRVHGSEQVLTKPGVIYEFPSSNQIISGGIAPFVSVGWAF